MAVLLMFAMPQPAHAADVTPQEMAEVRKWASAKFEGRAQMPKLEPGLVVLANHDAVQKNARAGRPLRLGSAEYRRGLYCHAVSKIIVRLPGPGKSFSAVVGVDSNEQTSGGRGSIVFSVGIGGDNRFSTDVMREGTPPIPVSVDLGGATEFTIEVGDAGDGISCDQADWADANVALADGRTIWLGDLPIIEWKPQEVYTTEPPFSFTYGDRPSAELLGTWKTERKSKKLDARRVEHAVSWTDPDTGLMVRCVGIEYKDFPTVEWTLHFNNTGSSDTPILADIRALDTHLERNLEGEFALHHHKGSPCLPSDYEPFRTALEPSSNKRITTSGGRSSNSDLPYFNIEWPGEGLIMVIGWPGQWAAEFTRDEVNGLRVRAGQELTHFKLHPGEEVRSPLIVMQFWKGDRVRAQNIWRRWMLEHNLPKPFGKPVVPQMAGCSSHQFGEMIHANEENQKFFVDRYLEEGLKLDYWWMDAGWYPNESGWPNTGTWEVDTERFPGGLRAITDHAHAKGVKSIVWFEPERVTPGTWLYENHPEWLLGPDGEQKLLNLGDPNARKWLTEHVDKLIVEQGIDLYRNDFNIDPLPYWRANDTPDRQGITEIAYVAGFLAYWDELRRRHPNMLIDTCASGGRRNDIETLRRSVPLHRSDYLLEPTSQQCHTYGIAFWIPFYGTGVNQFESYGFRSVMCPHVTACYDMRNRDADYNSVRRLVTEWRKIAPYYLGDYYPLTPYSTENDIWMAWQFDRPDLDEGMVQAFRRADSFYEAARFRLNGLDPEADYQVTDLDAGDGLVMSGRELTERGLSVVLKHQPGSAVIVYKRVKE